ncbi:hypothetical protein WN55_02592 [Dufourea novaeangliae]|uniref:Uncharacterized protein n=1 Tax=Dufourea novaeangliae TaxID=178035 RepID=A0A154PJ83_DUFNO|nr:hypothetical protein WN55_02592 [Dufourea novaeangliae]
MSTLGYMVREEMQRERLEGRAGNMGVQKEFRGREKGRNSKDVLEGDKRESEKGGNIGRIGRRKEGIL